MVVGSRKPRLRDLAPAVCDARAELECHIVGRTAGMCPKTCILVRECSICGRDEFDAAGVIVGKGALYDNRAGAGVIRIDDHMVVTRFWKAAGLELRRSGDEGRTRDY